MALLGRETQHNRPLKLLRKLWPTPSGRVLPSERRHILLQADGAGARFWLRVPGSPSHSRCTKPSKPFLMGGVISTFQTEKPVQRGSWVLPPPCFLPPWRAEGEWVEVAHTRSRSSASKAELYLPDPAASWSLLERIVL